MQGQLEHPAVVPVYDLGVGPDGGAYFTMKRIRGETLDEISRLLGSGDAAAAAKDAAKAAEKRKADLVARFNQFART